MDESLKQRPQIRAVQSIDYGSAGAVQSGATGILVWPPDPTANTGSRYFLVIWDAYPHLGKVAVRPDQVAIGSHVVAGNSISQQNLMFNSLQHSLERGGSRPAQHCGSGTLVAQSHLGLLDPSRIVLQPFGTLGERSSFGGSSHTHAPDVQESPRMALSAALSMPNSGPLKLGGPYAIDLMSTTGSTAYPPTPSSPDSSAYAMDLCRGSPAAAAIAAAAPLHQPRWPEGPQVLRREDLPSSRQIIALAAQPKGKTSEQRSQPPAAPRARHRAEGVKSELPPEMAKALNGINTRIKEMAERYNQAAVAMQRMT